ncbi:serine--tRNA ligase [Alicyclobacillus fodiniaquatilis]|uniref:Serine--tRNA ligase n=1 Tax=Alicyclobacillus fodiniaquatilis TaxID=1661150 RepID=A0ABW4JFG9_9BACL
MLDIKFIRENADAIQQVALAKGLNVSVTELLEVDATRLTLLRQIETLRHRRKTHSAQIEQLLQAKQQAEANRHKAQVRQINEELARLEAQFAKTVQRYTELMLLIPNIISPDTPFGASDADNVEIMRVGEPTVFAFPAKDHVTLAENLGMLDFPRGVKVAGTRGYFLKNAGLYLHRAVQQLALDVLYARGFTAMDVPLLVRETAMENTGGFPTGRDQTYHLPMDQKWLVGTSEVPLVSYHANEIVDIEEPIRLAAISNCFRREAGSAGRDVHGLYRVHQFAKVEQVVLCKNDLDTSLQLFEEITKNAQDILAMLELPYRMVAVCTGDLSQKNYKQYDIETWMPSRNSYGETHSSSILLDFQTRRTNIRYRDKDGALQFCHSLNNTAVATPRILIPLLENHQRPDGSIYMPKALRKYMNGLEELKMPLVHNL